MPKYAKFMKELLTNKMKLEEVDTMALYRNGFAIVDKKLPMKLKDQRSFVIPCLLGDGVEENTLADFGASINVMSYTIYMKLGLGELIPKKLTLQLADKSVRRPWGIVEDVLETVEKLIFLVDFVILDIDEDVETPLILRRSFLNTSRAIINWRDGKMTLKVEDEEMVYKLSIAMIYSMD
ncbi:uncharacterized protein LOC120270313 [Dioscorea cayenensis subsp. rotundata]|uniref:Uncharacterized protein LOC120270313 n=1 Tax=Dioscorea cayennensis subsp. rotundata TaxID=55577 RepID=A0AB40C0K4_DIOCR|nr:uncharacterized protein LOC120270313 [Dioscorea cayenensis subsp. rotundata]